MTVDNINKNQIKVLLSKEEITSFFGRYDDINYDDPMSRMTLNYIFCHALKTSEINLDCQRLMIEVKPVNDGCSILYTKVYRRIPRKFKKLSTSKTLLLIFDNCEKMIEGVERLYKKFAPAVHNSELFYLNGEYRLILTAERSAVKLFNCFTEYDAVISDSPTDISFTKEYGTVICKKNALTDIKNFFNI